MNTDAIKDLLFSMADDALIISHRNSEWTGIGPVLEEDIAFSSMAQDKLGHAYQLYIILSNSFDAGDPDQLAFNRGVADFRSSHLCELPIGEYDFSLVRHFLFSHAEILRYEMLETSSFEPLAQLATKIRGEIKYHIMHADTWIQKLGKGNKESHTRMQKQLDYAYPYALGVFELSDFESELASEKIFEGEAKLQGRWLENITPLIESSNLKLNQTDPILGGRKGQHTEHLEPLIKEMGEVFNIDVEASW